MKLLNPQQTALRANEYAVSRKIPDTLDTLGRHLKFSPERRRLRSSLLTLWLLLSPTGLVGAAIQRGGGVAQAASTAQAGTGSTGSNSANPRLPTSSLYTLHPGTTGGYLVETDPRFANYRTWLSSDYMLKSLGFDPSLIEKRLGDGFYEQKLIREQVSQLTGQRFLARV